MCGTDFKPGLSSLVILANWQLSADNCNMPTKGTVSDRIRKAIETAVALQLMRHQHFRRLCWTYLSGHSQSVVFNLP